MKRKCTLLVSIIAVVAGVLSALVFTGSTPPAYSAARRATPPDSYLHYKVYTVDQLVQQVRSNPEIRATYARTFHIPENKVVDYMRHNVVESYIPYTKTYTVYCVAPSGRIFRIHQVFRQGTKVFALRNGQPVFKWVCGNPLMSSLPVVKTKTKMVKSPAKVVTKISQSVETLIPNQAAVELVPSEEVALLPTAPMITTAASGAVISGPGGFPLWLPLLPLGFIHGGGGSSSTNTTGGATTATNTTTVGPTATITNTTTVGPTTTTTNTTTVGPTVTTNSTTVGPTVTTNTTGPNNVPEPSSSTTVALGFVPLIIGLLFSVRTKRRKRTNSTPTE